MNDRELLELAAKACDKAPGSIVVTGDGESWRYWNPLTDDGDALRLAVKLRIKSQYHEALGQALASVDGVIEYEARADIEKCGRDENACVRLAIVRAAAEIGKQAN